ncbi:MAG: hypothetical protein CL489_05235 [Acidobacteria bacterium]|nr:hypothetical protein [Acidobacteriota bacterium]|tara:strand:- start:477 stop:1451 length:975 start_codon:yes stop_codon:yes gene_type:complete
MAELIFQLLHNANGTAAVQTIGASGLAFYGTNAASSVQIGEYQDNTYVANADGSVYKDQTNNIKYVADTFPSGKTVLGGQIVNPSVSCGLSGVKSFQGTVGIEFGHTTAVKIQNAQLRIYDRANVNYPASGVNTKVAEIINHDGYTYASQGTLGNTSNVVGSGDILWWGEPWPVEMVGAAGATYKNSNGVVFINGTDADTNINGDSRLSSAAVAGSYDTVGGTGIIVPLSDSPGSGQKALDRNDIAGSSGPIWPKWTQYVNSTSRQALFFGQSKYNFDDGYNSNKAQGGTGVDTHHTWSIALSASPLSVGSKDQYGLYVSVEYL